MCIEWWLGGLLSAVGGVGEVLTEEDSSEEK